MVLDGKKTRVDQEPGVGERAIHGRGVLKPRPTTPTTEEYEIFEHQRTWDEEDLPYGGLKTI